MQSATTPQNDAWDVEDWGLTHYEAALQRQQEKVAAIIQGQANPTLVFTEHHPVITVGTRIGAEQHLLADPATLARQGIALHRTGRGGDVTYHGPGQLVGYLIVPIPDHDLHAHLRRMESALIASLQQLGLPSAGRRDTLTGIWLETRKIAAIGVAVRRWVAYHGFALNVTNSLDPFGAIVPCGITPDRGAVTRLMDELNPCPDMAQIKSILAVEFKRRFTHSDGCE